MKHTLSKAGWFWLVAIILMIVTAPAIAQVDTGGKSNTSNHSKEIVGYITNWDAWKESTAGLPAQGALTHLNIDYSKYTILNYSFFGVAVDGSLHSGDHRNKEIYKKGVVQQPKDIFFTDVYSSWDMHILFGEIEPIHSINQSVVDRAKKQGFDVQVGGNSWSNPTWGLTGPLPLPLHKETGAPGLLELAHQKGVKVVASIGGWSMCKHFPEMAADPVKRKRFVDDCVKLINVGFDGIDLDWEFPGPFSGMNFTGSQADYGNFTTLVKEIRAAIGPQKLVTAAFSQDPKKLEGFDWAALDGTMDLFNFMTYDYNGGWSDIAGLNSPLQSYTGAEFPQFNWQSTLDKLNQLGVNLSKTNMGMPFYGRGVICSGSAALNGATEKRQELVDPDGPITTCADYTNWPKDIYAGTPNYYFIKQKALGSSAWTRNWDSESSTPYLTNGKFFLSYDDIESIGAKASFINTNQLSGVIIWTVYGDLEFSGGYTSFGDKLKRWSSVKSDLVNKVNDVFADGSGGNKLPNVRITQPSDGASFNEGDVITILANATDSDGTIRNVQFFSDNAKIGESTASPYRYDFRPTSVGTFRLTAKATDNDNGSKTSTPVTITVKSSGGNTPPTVKMTSPKEGDTFKVGATIALSADATDSDGSVSKVDFYQGSILLGTDTTPPFTYSWGNVSEGSYRLTVKAKDNEGAATTSAAVSITVKNDPAPGPGTWDPNKTYWGGDQVSWKGHLWEAKWWTKNEEPGTGGEWDVWKDLGPL